MRIFFVKNRVVVVIFPLLLLSQQSLALEFSSSLSSETLYTNNSGLKSTSKLDDIVQTTGLLQKLRYQCQLPDLELVPNWNER